MRFIPRLILRFIPKLILRFIPRAPPDKKTNKAQGVHKQFGGHNLGEEETRKRWSTKHTDRSNSPNSNIWRTILAA